jgi:hypothetical protein
VKITAPYCAVSITNAVSITTAPFAAIFSALNQIFQLLTFFIINFKQIDTRNKRKKFEEKKSLQVQKTLLKKYVSTAAFLFPFLSEANNFRQILNHILIGLYIPMPGIKNQRGVLGRLF